MALHHGSRLLQAAYRWLGPKGLALGIVGGVLACLAVSTEPGASTHGLRRQQVLRGCRHAIHALAFSPDGTALASGGGLMEKAAELELWDLATGHERLTLSGHTGSIEGLAFGSDGSTLATVAMDRTVRLWDSASGRQRAAVSWQGGPPLLLLAFSADGTTLAWASVDGMVRLWDTTTGQVRVLRQDRTWGCSALAFSPDGQFLAAWGLTSGDVQLWEVATGRLRTILRGPRSGPALQPRFPYWALAYGPEGLVLASATGGVTVERWDAGRPEGRFLWPGQLDWVTALAFSPDGRLLAGANEEGRVKVWEVASGQERAADAGPNGPVTALAFSPDGRLLASASRDRAVTLWELADRRRP